MLGMQSKIDRSTYTALFSTSSFLCSSAKALEMAPLAPRPPVPSCFASATASSTSATGEHRQLIHISTRLAKKEDYNSPAYSSFPSSPIQNLIFSL